MLAISLPVMKAGANCLFSKAYMIIFSDEIKKNMYKCQQYPNVYKICKASHPYMISQAHFKKNTHVTLGPELDA